jgi:hypothetical protein
MFMRHLRDSPFLHGMKHLQRSEPVNGGSEFVTPEASIISKWLLAQHIKP